MALLQHRPRQAIGKKPPVSPRCRRTTARASAKVGAAFWYPAPVSAANHPKHHCLFYDKPSYLHPSAVGTVVPRRFTVDRLRHALARVARWYQGSLKESALPPLHVVKDLLAAPEPRLPVLRGGIAPPMFAPDGSLCVEPGYDPAGQTYFHPRPGFLVPAVPDHPTTAADIQQARDLIFELLQDLRSLRRRCILTPSDSCWCRFSAT